MYGELQASHTVMLLAVSICITASVSPLKLRPTAVQGWHEFEVAVPAASKAGTEPAGGWISTKFPPKKPAALPERFTVTEVVPALPLRLYAMSTLLPRVELNKWQLLAGHKVQVPPPPVTEEIVTLLAVLIKTTHTVPGDVGSILPGANVQLLDPAVQYVIKLSCM